MSSLAQCNPHIWMLGGLSEFWCTKTSSLEQRGIWRHEESEEVQGAADEPGEDPDDDEPAKPLRKLSACNVYTRDRSLGKTGAYRLSGASLSDEYKKLNEADKASLKKRARYAKAAARQGVSEPIGKR